jgi:hypothetical protein
MIVGATLNEFVTATNHLEYESMTDAELEQRVRGLHTGKILCSSCGVPAALTRRKAI